MRSRKFSVYDICTTDYGVLACGFTSCYGAEYLLKDQTMAKRERFLFSYTLSTYKERDRLQVFLDVCLQLLYSKV